MAAMKDQLIVAGVAALGTNDITGHGNRRTIRNEVEGGAGVAATQVEGRQVARAYDTDRRGHGCVKPGRGLSLERILILSPAQRRESTYAYFESRACDGTQRRARRGCRGIGHIFFPPLEFMTRST